MRFHDALLAVDPWSGTIDRVFEHAALVRPATAASPWLTLLHPSRYLVPWGIVMPWDAPLTPGSKVRLTREAIVIAAGYCASRSFPLAGEAVSLSLASQDRAPTIERLRAQLPEIDIPPLACVLLSPGVYTSYKLSTGGDTSPQELQLYVLGVGLSNLVAFVAGNATDPASAIEGLVGSGPGLTPSGDDVIAGAVAAATRMVECGWIDEARLDGLRSALSSLPPDSTTVVGREMLSHAARGWFPEPLARLAEGLGACTPSEARRRSRFLCRTGATSGGDMLAGLLGVAVHVVESSPARL